MERVKLTVEARKAGKSSSARALRRHLAADQTRLIAITAYGTEMDRRRSQEAGFDCHLVKPVDLEVLQDLLSQLPKGR